MSKLTNLTLPAALLLSSAVAAVASTPAPSASFARRLAASLVVAASDREQDGLNGPVRRVKTETAKISVKNGKPAEGQRAVLETTTYDQKGARVDTAYFLAAGGTLTGKEVYKYDDKGNMVEMTLHKDDGSLLSKETYSYEFDALGNWVKMTTSVAVIEGGKVTFEPSEVTYRTISYFLDDATLAKMSQPAAPAPSAATPSASPSSSVAASSSSAAAPSPSPAASNVAAQPSAQKPAPAANNGAAQRQADAAKPAANKAPVIVASLDKGSAPAASLPAGPSASNASAATEGGPAVKSAGDAPALAPKPVVRGPLKPISAGVLNGKAISLPAPEYPQMAKKTRATGTVEVEVIIDTNGRVISAKAVKGPALLLAAAEAAAKQARFTPSLLSGQPVKVSGVINYTFSLN